MKKLLGPQREQRNTFSCLIQLLTLSLKVLESELYLADMKRNR